VNVDLTMAHCYSNLSRLPAKVEQDSCAGENAQGKGCAVGRGNRARRTATRARWRNIFNGGCLG